MLKKHIKTILVTVFTFSFIGTASVLATWPNAPAGSSSVAGWIGDVFDVVNSNSTTLIVNKEIQADSFIYTSDKNLKTKVKTLDNSLEKIQKLRGVSFEWTKNGEEEIGFIAQEVEGIYPELVETNELNNLKSLKYGNITAILVEALKEQQKEIDLLKAEIEKLK